MGKRYWKKFFFIAQFFFSLPLLGWAGKNEQKKKQASIHVYGKRILIRTRRQKKTCRKKLIFNFSCHFFFCLCLCSLATGTECWCHSFIRYFSIPFLFLLSIFFLLLLAVVAYNCYDEHCFFFYDKIACFCHGFC